MNVVLADWITVRSRFARSANVERDIAQPEPLDGYVITARGLNVLGRIAATAADGKAGGAWSITGPYGSGKSSLALLIDAVFGPSAPTQEAALRLVGEASSTVEAAIRVAHERFGTWNTGFCRGIATAERESINLTLLRALQTAYRRRLESTTSPPSQIIHPFLSDAEINDFDHMGRIRSSILQIARALAEESPLLLVIDEFGKNLEAVRDGHGDPFVLQQLAEIGQGAGLPIFLVTLQHVSLEEYLVGTEVAARREWAKVQGRFEEVSFVNSAGELRALIGSAFVVRDTTIKRRIACWAASQAEAIRSMGFGSLAEPDSIASCYPLHPLTALVLPELCNRYGQHERTLFSFLTSQNPASARRFLVETEIPPRGLLPSLGLESVYDYFVGSGMRGAWSDHRVSRWAEIATRLRDATGLSDRQIRMAKRIGILNLISTSGKIRASRTLLSLTDPQADEVLADLVETGIATYRDFADEYRIWQGSDVDIGRMIERSRAQLREQPLVEMLSALDPLAPIVAARHSAENDVLRVFGRRYADAAVPVEPLDPFFRFDGENLLIVDSIETTPKLASSVNSPKPIVAAIPQNVSGLGEAVRDVLAIRMIINEPPLAEDWVARRETAERLAQAQVNLDALFHKVFRPDGCRWVLLEPSGERELPVGRGTHALSCAADIAFRFTPKIGNEMLNRTRLTSQGAKARRLLVSAMIERELDSDLSLKGYGPEVAMYRALLQRTGIHRLRAERNEYCFGPPPATDSLAEAWRLIEEQFELAKGTRINFRDVYAMLLSSPVGMKEGVIPVLITAALLACRDEIAIYEHGSFRPLLTREVSERMVRNPYHFDFKHYANTTGARKSVINAIARQLDVRPLFRQHRVPNVLGIAGHLVSQVRRLDNFTLRTHSLSPDALAVRSTIVTAVEPDELLFIHLPKCFELPSVPVDATRYTQELSYAKRLGQAMAELTGRYPRLEKELLSLLLRTVAEKTWVAVSGKATLLDEEILDPTVRAFVLALKGNAAETENEWISTIATVLSKKAPKEWTDRDLFRYQYELRIQIGTFQRLLALHVDSLVNAEGQSPVFRLTITWPDGREHDRLVSVDAADRTTAENIFEDALEVLKSNLGSYEHAESALLACFAERLHCQLVETPTAVTDSEINSACYD